MHFQPAKCAVKFGGLRNLARLRATIAISMRFIPRLVLACACLAAAAPRPALADSAAAPKAPRQPILEAKLRTATDEDYARPKHRVGLKIYTDSGPGLATSPQLVKGVIQALRRRGFENRNIFLVGLNQLRLRMTGYLPSLVTGKTPFEGNPVYVLESGRYYDPVWYYDSPLPERFNPLVAEQQTRGFSNTSTRDEDRKSFLATPLFLDADFWINLPVYTDHQVLGVNGALVNATLWNASNTARFFRSPANAPAAVAEMSAIPELRETWAFTIASLETYQFIGGPFFNSLYTTSEPILWLSGDPVLMDSLMRDRMNLWRKRFGFDEISDEIRTLEDAELLGSGSTQTKNAVILPVY
jgi:hypothetical protein